MRKNKWHLFAEERKRKIVEYVEEHKKATVQELRDYFGVSSSTIRYDLNELNKKNQLVRMHGGALVQDQVGHKIDIDHRIQNRLEKENIAREALGLIEDGDTIILDTGTTTYEIARKFNERSDVTVVTNDLRIALMLEFFESVSVLFMGGILRRNYHCTVGDAGREMLSGLSVDKAFMGANSLSVDFGASTPDLNTAETKKAMIARAKKVVIVCDSSKLNQSSFAQFARLEDIDTIITEKISREERAKFENYDIEVVVAGSEEN